MKITGQFVPHLIQMLRSPAYRVLSLSGHRILARIEIEHADHGGRDNGKLPVTFADLVAYGITDRHSIAHAIHEVCALGFVELTRPGRAGGGEYRSPNLYRLTYLPSYGKPPTHEWRMIETVEEARRLVRKCSRASKKRSRGKKFTSGGIHTVAGVESTPLRVWNPHRCSPDSEESNGVETTLLLDKGLAI